MNSLMINFIIWKEGQDSIDSVLVIHFLGLFVARKSFARIMFQNSLKINK